MSGVVEGHVVDFLVENHGTIVLLRPVSLVGFAWLHDSLQGDGPRLGDAYAVEPRYVEAIVNGALEDGLRIGA